jgi:SAM-dependent methyltransferase
MQLFLLSLCVLFTELALIRWIPALVTYVGFFSNFLLMASFLGIGLGILLGRNGIRMPASPFPFLLLATLSLVTSAQLNVKVRSEGEIFFGIAESTSADVNFIVLPLVVILVTAVMAALALPLGPLLRSMPPLKAYAVDISGSLAGIAAFAALSLLGTAPALWFAVVAGLLGLMALGRGFTAWSLVGGTAMLAVIYGGSLATPGVEQQWSPYYRVDVFSGSSGLTGLSVNGIPHQSLYRADDETKNDFYDQVYRWYPNRQFDSVLVVGAGTGTDVAIALERGAGRVDAVEIDPVIQRLGVERHPNDPYGDPRVTAHLNDGRAFLRTTDKRYDLVVFALPDSLTLVSSTANLRLESFLFTEEAFRSVREHLTDDGIFVLYNYYREPWLIEKLDAQLETAFGHEPFIRLYQNHQAALAAGPLVESGGGSPPGDKVDAVQATSGATLHAATDDWPFLYLREPSLAPYYLAALAFMTLLAAGSIWYVLRRTNASIGALSPHFFALGVAFLLLETKSLASFALLFGTTWIVNALVFFAILVSVLLSVGVTAWFKPRRMWPLYLGLVVSLTVGFLIPPERLLLDPPVLRYTLAAVVAFAPVFFANLVFTYSFRETRAADIAFASNLVGAMLGGVLEYAALLIGYRWLLVVVAIAYALAYLLATRWRILGDRVLVAGR